MALEVKGLSLIGFARGATGVKIQTVLNPATQAPLAPGYQYASTTELDRAGQLASAAYPTFVRLPGSQRAIFLRRIAELLEANAAAIIERGTQETGLPLGRLQGEMGRTVGQLRLFASLLDDGWWVDARIDHADPARKPVPKPDVRSMLRGLGPVAVFSASNFPLAFSVAGGDTASAFAAGCPVIVKAHQGHPGTSELTGLVIQQAVKDCGLPEGTFSLLFGSGREIGIGLVKHPLIKAVGFTGSGDGGRALMDAAAARPEPIPVYAEMGSINPVFFLSEGLNTKAEELATGLHGSVTLGVGQFCTNPGIIFVETGAAAEKFLKKLAALLGGTAPGTMLTSSICESYREGVAALAKSAGVEQLAGVPGGPGQGGAALFATDAATFFKDHLLMREVFGPSTLVIRCSSRAEMLKAAQTLEGQLTATLHGTETDLAGATDLIALLETKAGRVLLNGFPTGVEVCHAMNHGGPYPATADGRSTSVGTRAIVRFSRPVCLQNFSDALLPDELKEANPLRIPRLVDGRLIVP